MAFSANVRGALLGLAAFAVFSTHDVLIKVLGSSYSAIQIVFFSALMSFPFITLLLIREQKPGTLRPAHPWWLGLRSVAGAVSAICAFYAFSTLPLPQVYAFIFAAPLIITVLAVPMLGEKIRLRRGLAVLIGLGGVLYVLQPGARPLETGHIAAIAAAASAALNAVIVRKIGKDERRVVMILFPILTNLVLTAVALPFVYRPLPVVDLGLFAIVGALVLIAMMLTVAAYQTGEAIVVAPMQYSQIIWGTLFGVLLFDEELESHTMVGTAIIIASGLYILFREATRNVSTNTPVLNTRTRLGNSSGLRVGLMEERDKQESNPYSPDGG